MPSCPSTKVFLMTPPSDPDQPTYGHDDPLVAQPEITEPAVTEHVEAPQSAPMPVATPAPVPTEHAPESEEHGAGSKVKAAAVLAGAAALANKVRQDAPKRWQEIREKRVAGRCVILMEVAGRQVAVGPYRNDTAARQDSAKLTGAPKVIELISPAVYMAPENGEDTALR